MLNSSFCGLVLEDTCLGFVGVIDLFGFDLNSSTAATRRIRIRPDEVKRHKLISRKVFFFFFFFFEAQKMEWNFWSYFV